MVGVSRVNHAVLADGRRGKLYEELREEIGGCERVKGTNKSLLNIACDAIIAVSSLDHDFLITCDKCLFESCQKVMNKHKMLGKNHVLRVIYAHPDPK